MHIDLKSAVDYLILKVEPLILMGGSLALVDLESSRGTPTLRVVRVISHFYIKNAGEVIVHASYWYL